MKEFNPMRIQPLFGGSAFVRAGQLIQATRRQASQTQFTRNALPRSADTTHFGAFQKATGTNAELDEYKDNVPGAQYLAQTHKAATRGSVVDSPFPLKGFYVSSKKPNNVWIATGAEKEKLDAALKQGDDAFEKVFAGLKSKKKYGI